MNIYDLKTAAQSSPIGLDLAAPAFSWKLKGDGKMQYSYRIKVISEKYTFDMPDMWDSGVVNSSSSFGIVYGGKDLRDRTKYLWQVEVNGVLSEIASFETAFINSENFKAEWIGMPLAFSGYTDIVRLEFATTKPVKRARLYLAALGCARVSLNGSLVDDSYFDGAVSVYEKRIFYRTYALETIRLGANALAIELGYGFYGAKKLYGEVFLEYDDGSTCVIPTICGRVWMITHGSVTSNSVYGGEHCDGRLRQNFSSPDFFVNTTDYVSAYAVEIPSGKLKSCPIPPMRIMEKFAPKEIRPLADGSMLIDAGRNLTGFIEIVVSGDSGANVKIEYAEVLDNNGNISKTNLRRADCVDKYILAGGKNETYAPCFTYHGFRYVKISFYGNVSLLDVKVMHLRTAIDQIGEFSCSDENLNALHLMAARTESNNLNGIFTDCPQRDERLGWLNDMTSRIYQSVCNFDLSNFLPNFIDLITLSANVDGAIGDTVPFLVGSRVADPVSAYHTLAMLLMRFYGDKITLKRNYDGLCKWLNKLNEYVDDGVLNYGLYGDWCPASPYAKSDGTHSQLVSVEFMSAAYYVWYHEMMREFAASLDLRDDEKAWSKKEKACIDAFYAKYYDEKSGLFGGGSQTECVVAMTIFKNDTILCEKLASHAVEDIKRRSYHTTCGNQGYRHLFYRLAEYGYSEDLVKLLKNPDYPGWGNMLARGATSVWERWECEQGSDMHSYNHPMFGSYDGFFYNYLAGIRTNKCVDAFGKIVIEPCFVSTINFVSAKIETLRGTISVAWRRENGNITLEISTPANTCLNVVARGMHILSDTIESDDELTLSNGNFRLVLSEKKELSV